MRCIRLTAPGLDGIAVAEATDPVAGPGEVLLRMRAASVNARDLAVASGRLKVKLPLVPLSDGIGVVEAVGSGVTRVKPGDRVLPIFAPRWISGPSRDETSSPALGGDVDGVMRERMVCSAESVVRAPMHLSDTEAATLPCAAVTAWSAVVDYGQVRPGETVLVEGTGGVALFALQFARLAGARVVVVSSSGERLERARALGAAVGINYRETPEWGPAVRQATGGVDVVIETGGAQTLGQALASVNRGARIAQVGMLTGIDAMVSLRVIIPRAVNIQGIYVGSRTSFESMVRAMELHQVRPLIAHTFGFSDFRPALEHMAKGGHFGKLVLEIG